MKLLFQSALLALTAAANVQAECTPSAVETLTRQAGNGPSGSCGNSNEYSLDPNDLPIEIISQNPNGEEVTFGFVQNVYESLISKVALSYYSDPEEIACEVNSGMDVDDTATYTAVCFEGIATIHLFFHFCETEDTDCDYCALPDSLDNYYALTFELECYQECTPSPTPPLIEPTPTPPTPTRAPTAETNSEKIGSNGDPHFKSWKGEHFEYHGQCDMVLAKDDKFANGLGLDVQIRTKLVRFWSYINRAAILIGDDILEVEGIADPEAGKMETNYWYNLEYKGLAKTADKTIGGFPLKIWHNGVSKSYFEIDLNSKYPGQKITLSTYREFVRVDFEKASKEAFGNTVGILGDFQTGNYYARDGTTEMTDFVQLGNEWQVLPADNMLFHDKAEPQFPRRCIEPEDPRGERRRRLGESTISMEQAEAACKKTLTNPLDIKDCVYDILATQDLDMVGAF